MSNTEEDNNLHLDIVWIDEKIKNLENQNYFEEMKLIFQNIKINTFNNLDKGFNYLLKLNFKTIFIIISGSLYTKYYYQLRKNIKNLKIIPITIIFTSEEYKKILEKKDNENNPLISYDILKSLNHPFYNLGGIFDDIDKLYDFLKKFDKNFKNKSQIEKYKNLSYDGLFTFKYIDSVDDMFVPLIYKDLLTKKEITELEIQKFNDFLLDYKNEELTHLIKPLNNIQYFPKEILCKYWLRAYTIDCNFYKEMNNKLMSSNFDLFNIFVKLMYKGIELNIFNSSFNCKLYRGANLNIDEINEINKKINSNKKVLVFCKAFLSFSKNIDFASDYLETKTPKTPPVFFEIKEIDLKDKENIDISNIEIKNFSNFYIEDEILFLPGSSFLIEKKIEDNFMIKGIKSYKITLNYIGKFNNELTKIYNDNQKIKNLASKDDLIKEIFELHNNDKNFFSFSKNNIEFLNNGKYFILDKIIDIDFEYKREFLNKNTLDENYSYPLYEDPMFLIKNRITNTTHITYLFYKVNYKKSSFMTHLNFVKKMSDLPYSLKLIEYFEDNHFYYCVYDYFDETLKGFIQKNGPISCNLIHKILMQLNICLKKLNEMSAIHKFINPENIFITYLDESKQNFDIKLGGYDITNERKGSKSSGVCLSGKAEYEKCYIAPEIESIMESKNFEEKDFKLCDLFSIGALIYYLSTKKKLFRKSRDKINEINIFLIQIQI